MRPRSCKSASLDARNIVAAYVVLIALIPLQNVIFLLAEFPEVAHYKMSILVYERYLSLSKPPLK
jgi:hypothetical protein